MKTVGRCSLNPVLLWGFCPHARWPTHAEGLDCVADDAIDDGAERAITTRVTD